ncbi:HEPN domain-containing protein [Pseudoalteromonas shioyasakiensis]|uniref:HEPN domain-containing protein n=1 Tax=Pseudoalteromonas shioyasakiensis TaxID=1190813 RepID=UPI000786484B|nr:HEPN domain-containing protein [Pseudoalteromonas shioyasakiensis]
MLHKELKEKQRKLRDNFPEGLALRVHRALSWLDKSEQCNQDLDCQFIFLWVSFNAAYAQDTECLSFNETQSFSHFLEKLDKLDSNSRIYNLLWNEFPNSIRVLLSNKFVFQPFWQLHNKQITEQEYAQRFSDAKLAANYALANEETAKLTSIVLQRLYTLRNQLIHGGATWNSSANREQLKDAVQFLSQLVPFIIDIMMDNPNELWGDAHYPLINK